jgi:hypothetical protein
MAYLSIKKLDDSINSKSKPLHSTNIWINNINYEVNDSHPTIPITNTINFEHYNLQFDFVINHVMDQTKNENITKSSYFMMMQNFEYCSLLGQLNEE